jgi:hypothetical protein
MSVMPIAVTVTGTESHRERLKLLTVLAKPLDTESVVLRVSAERERCSTLSMILCMCVCVRLYATNEDHSQAFAQIELLHMKASLPTPLLSPM